MMALILFAALIASAAIVKIMIFYYTHKEK